MPYPLLLRGRWLGPPVGRRPWPAAGKSLASSALLVLTTGTVIGGASADGGRTRRCLAAVGDPGTDRVGYQQHAHLPRDSRPDDNNAPSSPLHSPLAPFSPY